MGEDGEQRSIRRRSFLHGSVVGGATLLAGCPDQAANLSTPSTNGSDNATVTETPEKGFAGTVLDVGGEPVPGATVKLYDRAADADSVILETTTSEGENAGVFEFPELSNESVRELFTDEDGTAALVVQSGDWFDTLLIPELFGKLPLALDITLQQELLTGPALVTDDSRDKSLSMLTCWRMIFGADTQTIYIEISDIRDRPGFEPYEIEGKVSDIAGGGFSMTVLGDDLWINFGSQTKIDGTQPDAVEVLTLNNVSDNSDRISWHPVRTELPMYALGRGFTSTSTTDVERSNTIDEGIGKILVGAGGLVPGLSTLISWIDAIDWAFGDRLDYEATLGDIDTGVPDPFDPTTTQRVPDPNTHTSALIGWEADNPVYRQDASAVVAMIPLQFREEGANETSITVRAEWNQNNGHGTYGETFQIDAPGTIERDSPEEGGGSERDISGSINAQNGLAYNAGDVYFVDEGQIRQYDRQSDSVVNSFDIPDSTRARGLAFGADSLWFADWVGPDYDGAIAELDPQTGEVRSTISSYWDPRGLAFGEGSLWAVDITGNRIVEYSPSGEVLSSFSTNVTTWGLGLAYFDGSLWLGDNCNDPNCTVSLYEYDTNGNLLQQTNQRTGDSPTGYGGLAATDTELLGPDTDGNVSVLRSFD